MSTITSLNLFLGYSISWKQPPCQKIEDKAAVQVAIIDYYIIDLIFKLLLEHESKRGLYLFVLVDFVRIIIRLIQ